MAKVAGFCVQRGRMQALGSLGGSAGDPNRLKQSLGEAKKTVDSLKQNNLFIKAPPKQNPVKQVEGILGQEALIGGKWYKAGDKVADAKIIAVAATQVEVEWDGKKTSFAPITSVSAGPADAAGRARGSAQEGSRPATAEDDRSQGGQAAGGGRSPGVDEHEVVAEGTREVPADVEQHAGRSEGGGEGQMEQYARGQEAGGGPADGALVVRARIRDIQMGNEKLW